jgi:Papain family cysteine protease
MAKNQIDAGGTTRSLTAIRDFPDLRDRFYEPPLIELPHQLRPTTGFLILDQGTEGSCTGFAAAAALNILRQKQGSLAPGEGVSPRMLYEMAKLHDEWEGSGYEGSSVRGAIKGFFHNGVCTENDAPYLAGQANWTLTVPQAKAARNVILGSYYRLRPVLVDYHAALQQAGTIIASATIHEGWTNPPRGRIEYSTRSLGGHAFTIVGYDDEGFIIQNSWGPAWGNFGGADGLAHWNYHDWAETVVDAWVMRLAVPTPKAFELTHLLARSTGPVLKDEIKKHSPRRQDVIGHIIHLDDGKLVEAGTYGTPMASIEETARLLHEGASKSDRYEHILFYAHGGITDAVAAARRTSATRDGFKRNGVYPIHFLWETGLMEEVLDILAGKMADRGGKVSGFQDAMDFLLEKLTGTVGRALWREMKTDAARAFERNAQSAAAVKAILGANRGLKKPYKIHFVGHSAGSNFVSEFMAAWARLAMKDAVVENCFLLGAACTVAQYERDLVPALDAGALKHLTIYNLSQQRELDDSVGPYSKSLLYLVSHAFEESPKTAILGMAAHSQALPKHKKQTVLYTAGADLTRTDARSHGGYGTDLVTLNDILKTIRGSGYQQSLAFRQEELDAV